MTHRTTLTLDDDVAARIERAARHSGRPYRTIVNEALRAGLERAESSRVEPFSVSAKPLGLRTGIGIDDIEGLLDRLDGPGRR